MTIRRFTRQAPATAGETLLLDPLKARLRLLSCGQDDSLKTYLKVSVDLLERYTNRIFNECLVKGEFGFVTVGTLSGKPMLPIACAPIFDDALIDLSIKTSQGFTPLDGAIYPVYEYGECYINDSDAVNDFDENTVYPIVVNFKAGYPVADKVWSLPAALQDAIIGLAAYMFDNPTDCGANGCGCGASKNGVHLPPSIALLVNYYVIKRVLV
jgi:hypothetical protein